MIGLDLALLMGEKAAANQEAPEPGKVVRFGKHASIVWRKGPAPSTDIVVKKDGFDYRVFNDMSNDSAHSEAEKLFVLLERNGAL
jgi:hypothetical protein